MWSLVDEGIVRDASFYTVKDIWSPVQLAEPERFTSGLSDDFDGRIHLTNHYAFTNTRTCGFTWRLLNFRTFRSGGTATPCAPKAPPPRRTSDPARKEC